MELDIEPLVQTVLTELDDDECDLQWVLDTVNEKYPDAAYADLKRTVLEVVRELINRGLAEPHLLGDTSVAAVPTEKVFDEIRRGWDRLGEQLRMGDVAYFSITPAGRTAVRSASQP